MELLNFCKLKGKPMRMFSEHDPSKRKSGRGNVFVKNLDESIDDEQLSSMFSVFGKVLSSKVARDASGVSKGYGFVQFYSELSVDIACNVDNGKLIRNKHIHVCPFVSRRQWDESSVFTNVYVKNLAETVTDADLKRTFEEFGEITSAVVMKDGEGKSRKFGFVNFEKAEAAVAAIEKMNGKVVDEKELYVGRAQRKKNRVEDLIGKFQLEKLRRDERIRKGLSLYVKNLEDPINEEKLQELFSEHGTITSCKVMVRSNGLSKGVGFVEFSTSEEALKAMLKMNGKMVGKKAIYVSLAKCKEEGNIISHNIVLPIPRPSIHQQTAAPTTMLPPPQPSFGGYSFQPQLMFGPRLPICFPSMHMSNFMAPQPFPLAQYRPTPQLAPHCGLPLSLLQPQQWNSFRQI